MPLTLADEEAHHKRGAFGRGGLLCISFIFIALIGASFVTFGQSSSRAVPGSKVQFQNANRNPRYFPAGAFNDNLDISEFVANLFAYNLRLMQEPSLLEPNQGPEAFVCRLVRLNTFGSHVSVRLSRRAGGRTGELTVTVLSNNGDLISRTTGIVAASEVTKLSGMLQETHFWSLPSKEVDESPVPLDGTAWLIECQECGNSHLVYRRNPKPSGYTDLGRYLVKELGKLDDSVVLIPDYRGHDYREHR